MAHSIFLLTKLLFYSKAICYSLIILSPFRYKSGGGHKYISFLYLFSVDSHSSICNLYSFLIPISFYFQTWLSGLGAGGNTRGMHFESSHRPYHLFYFKTWLRCRRQHKRSVSLFVKLNFVCLLNLLSMFFVSFSTYVYVPTYYPYLYVYYLFLCRCYI